MASTESTGVDTTASGPAKGGFAQRLLDFVRFLYNSEKGTVLGRTAGSWGKIGLFYLVYYAFLAGFFAAMCGVFYQTLDRNYPRLQGADSLLKGNPGLGFRPMPDITTTLIRFKKAHPSTYTEYTDHIDVYLQYYENELQTTESGAPLEDCKDIRERRPQEKWDTACRFDLSLQLEGSNCTRQKTYGYDSGHPCVLLKMNRVFDWIPEEYSNETVPEPVKGMYDPYSVMVKCEGQNPSDSDNLGDLQYSPKGFHYKYFPYRNQQGYRSPLVMVEFNSITTGVLVMVECKLYARNIYHNNIERAGMVRFEILMD